MSISNEALQKLAQEIENQVIQSQQQIGIVKSQIAMKSREIRKLDLTTKEIAELPSDTNMYEGVGKMFVFSPTADVNKRLKTESNGLSADVENLGKRLQYLETTFKNSQAHMDQIFKSGGRV
ncbi:prefoldin subunit 1 [Diplocarpon rosae]|nr:prefoldin subunit 1 [Diplocarpon rosae]